MLAFYNDPTLKAKYLSRVQDHQAADEIAQGFYWESGRGCAVGCTIHGRNHMAYERELGIPVMLARLEDQIFEGLPLEMAKAWPARFLGAVTPGSDLSQVGWKFLHWLLTDQIRVEGEGKIFDDVRKAIKQCADVLVPLKDGGVVDKDAAYVAADAAANAAYAARAAAYAADAAAYAAGAAGAARAAAYAADAAAYAAGAAGAARAARAAAGAARAARAVDAAAGAVDAAAYAARAAYVAAYVAANAAYAAAYQQMADKLIELIEAEQNKGERG
jgi:hypothetical protein